MALVPPAVHFLMVKTGTPIRRMIGVMYLLVIAGLGCRSVAAFELAGHPELYTSHFLQNAGYMGLFIGEVIGNICFLLLTKEEADRRLEMVATTDSLTGLNNRHQFFELAPKIIARCDRQGESVAFIIMDIDHFKKVNDQYGHQAGDDMLRVFAETVAATLRPVDLFARLGGEEFVTLLPRTGPAEAMAAAERIRGAVAAARLPIEPGGVSVTVSLGVSVKAGGDGERTLDSYYRAADQALYRAKAGGRNRVDLVP